MKTLKNGIEIVSLEDSTARVQMLSPFDGSGVIADPKMAEKIAQASQWFGGAPQANDNFNFQNAGDVQPQPQDYILVRFRALSKTIVPGHWIDWSLGNVLEESVPLLKGATVFANHDRWDVNKWLGSVSQAIWDSEGKFADGVPGINAEYKIDALMNPRIARGLLMSPPAIHSTSMTVLFEFDYSHPDIALENKWKFFDLLGEEVDGEIVRLIATKIREYWEASFVPIGADRLAKKQPDDEVPESFAEKKPPANAGGSDTKEREGDADEGVRGLTPPNSNEEKTMKLTKEQKAELGIEFDGDDVPEAEILKAAESLATRNKEFDGFKPAEIAQLQQKAKDGDKFIELQRTEVTRLAKLAELGADEGDLPAVVAGQIKAADFDTLVQLEEYFNKKVGEKFPETARSSQEDGEKVEAAGGVKPQTTTVPKVGLH